MQYVRNVFKSQEDDKNSLTFYKIKRRLRVKSLENLEALIMLDNFDDDTQRKQIVNRYKKLKLLMRR